MTLLCLGLQVYIVRGNVNESLTVQMSPRMAAACGMAEPPPPRQAWVKEPYPEDAALQYWFTKWVAGAGWLLPLQQWLSGQLYEEKFTCFQSG